MTGLERVGGAAGRRVRLDRVIDVALDQGANDSAGQGKPRARLPRETFQRLMENTSQARAVDVEGIDRCLAYLDGLRDTLMSARAVGDRGDHQAQNEWLDAEEAGE